MHRLVAVSLAMTAGCLGATVTRCEDGRLCPDGRVCDEVHHACVFPDQLVACDTLDELDPCPIASVADAGRCRDGVCVAASCGDGLVTGIEECDGAPGVDADDCTDHGFYDEGAVTCTAACTFELGACSERCGDQVLDLTREDCEPTDLGGVTDCQQLGYHDAAPLACTSFCTFDVSACSGVCGDGIKDGPEECDGADLGGVDCTDLGYYQADVLACDALCRFDVDGCLGFCGDGLHNDPSEACDGGPPPAGSCVDFGYDAGALGCSGFCTPGFDACGHVGWEVVPTGDDYTVHAVWSDGVEVFTAGQDGRLFHFDGVSWSQQDSPTTQLLRDLDGTDADDVFAVGAGGTILHWDGAAWTQQTTQTTQELRGVFMVSATDGWAVGTGGAIQRYDGTSWSTVASGTSNMFYDVHGYAPDAVFAVTSSRVYRWNGAAWVFVATTAAALRGVWAGAADQVYFADGNGLILKLVGTSLVIQAAPPNEGLEAIHGTGPTDLYAVGWPNAILHFDGTTWRTVDGSFSGYPFYDVWAAPGGAVYVASDYPPVFAHPGRYFEDVTPLSGNGLFGAWGAAADDVYAVGTVGRLIHFDGTVWSTQTSNVTGTLSDIWGSGPRDVFAVGTSSITHYDGSAWTAQPAPLTGQITSVWGSGPDDVWATTGGAGLFHYDGATWSTAPGVTTAYGVWGSGPDDVWVVGTDGAIEHHDGTSWIAVASPTTRHLLDVWGSGPDDVFAVGVAGTILHYDGTTWTQMDSRAFAYLDAVWGFGPDDVFAAGEFGVVLHYDGAQWAPVRAASEWFRRGMWGTPRTSWFVGDAGQLMRFDRHAPWTCQPSEVYCADTTDDDCDGAVDADDADCAALLALSEVHAGATDYVELVNRGVDHANLVGITITWRGSCDGAPHSYTFAPDAIVGPGEVYRVVDTTDVGARERHDDVDACAAPDGGGWVALCAGACDLATCSNVLDYVAFTGTTAPASPPACAAFTPIAVTGATTADSLTRSGADWAVAPASRD